MTILKVTYGNPVASIKCICEHVPVYSPQKVARSLGFYGGETYDGSGNPSGN